MKDDILYLVWVSNEKKYKIGILCKKSNNKYTFKYIKDGLYEALKKGLILSIGFPDFDLTYENDYLFPFFASRLPDEKRPDIKKILDYYGMDKYDQFELLKRSGGRLPIDHYEFIQ